MFLDFCWIFFIIIIVGMSEEILEYVIKWYFVWFKGYCKKNIEKLILERVRREQKTALTAYF